MKEMELRWVQFNEALLCDLNTLVEEKYKNKLSRSSRGIDRERCGDSAI
jgi:hypothetical protein